MKCLVDGVVFTWDDLFIDYMVEFIEYEGSHIYINLYYGVHRFTLCYVLEVMGYNFLLIKTFRPTIPELWFR